MTEMLVNDRRRYQKNWIWITELWF